MSNVVITGSSRGLGYAMAKVFLQKNCNVTICSRNQDAVQQAVNSLPNHSQSVLGISCDVRQRDDIVEVWQRSALR
ncbi:MAG: SDR family NAD(P)-dependent oxidoreductase, partial [Bacilli bacterium]